MPTREAGRTQVTRTERTAAAAIDPGARGLDAHEGTAETPIDRVPTGCPAWTARVLGLRVDDVPVPELLDRIVSAIERDERLLVLNANAHMVLLARSQGWLREMFETADVVFCDGAGVQFALRLLTGRKPNRSTPPQWIDALGARLARHGATVFWLGGHIDAVGRAAEALERRTGLRSVGCNDGFFDHTPGSADNEDLVGRINAARPDLLLVNMGMPLQEKWLRDHWHRLDVPVALTAGALVDHVAGIRKRPPMWVAELGVEWLVRLAIEPRRLWRRYLLGLPVFVLLVLREAFDARRARTAKP